MSTPPSKLADRIDKWLWAVRVFKTRSLAADACHAGSVSISEAPVKPARGVNLGETIEVKEGVVLRTLKVVGIPKSRVGPKLVAQFCEELTPESEWEKAKVQRLQHVLERERGSGRPTKRDRREIDRFFEP